MPTFDQVSTLATAVLLQLQRFTGIWLGDVSAQHVCSVLGHKTWHSASESRRRLYRQADKGAINSQRLDPMSCGLGSCIPATL